MEKGREIPSKYMKGVKRSPYSSQERRMCFAPWLATGGDENLFYLC